MTPEEALRFLSDPASFEPRPDSVEIVQTHISIVALAGSFVYKVRKPVDFGFLDYSTPDRRRHFSHREVELNRRLCPDVYLDVLTIVRRDGRLCFGPADPPGPVAGSDESTVDYAVHMRRLDERWFLSSLLEADRQGSSGKAAPADHGSSPANAPSGERGPAVGSPEIRRIVDALVPFYSSQPPVPGFGTLEHVKEAVVGNLDLCAKAVGQAMSKPAYDALRRITDGFVVSRAELFQRRVAAGWIRDCHGDLRPMHIHLGPDRVAIYDCIEFNDNLRCIDVTADVAFLGMELAYAGRWDLGDLFLERVRDRLDDPEMDELLDFYRSYRAAVRGKVAWLLAQESEHTDEARAASLKRSRGYFRLALRFALFGAGRTVICVMGRVGTGKSTTAAAIGDALGWPVFSSDPTRKRLAGVEPTVRPDEDQRRKLYAPEMTRRTYDAMTDDGRGALETTRGAVLDATFGRASYRRRLTDVVTASGGRVIFVELVADDELLRDRLAQRAGRSDVVSDARLDDFDRLSSRYEPPEELPSARLIRVDAAASLETTISQILTALADRPSGDHR